MDMAKAAAFIGCANEEEVLTSTQKVKDRHRVTDGAKESHESVAMPE